MPRLRPSLIRHASRRHVLLPLLLRECRDIESAVNELQWLKEHALGARALKIDSKRSQSRSLTHTVATGNSAWHEFYRSVLRRSRGEPLQYIIGNQPFGDLEILCRKDVLIPRPETELYTTKLAEILQQVMQDPSSSGNNSLKVLDLCTGTGCIALLLHSLLKPVTTAASTSSESSDELHNMDLEILGSDVSASALGLAQENLTHNIGKSHLRPSATQEISFHRSDILGVGQDLAQILSNEPMNYDIHEFGNSRGESTPWQRALTRLLQSPRFEQITKGTTQYDVVISNPPYISPLQYAPGGTTSRSVRVFEPKLALVPPVPSRLSESHAESSAKKVLSEQLSEKQADQFYTAVTAIAQAVHAKVIVMEVGDSHQARRVGGILDSPSWTNWRVEYWYDDGRVLAGRSRGRHAEEAGRLLDQAQLQSASSVRAIAVWRGEWAQWRERNPE